MMVVGGIDAGGTATKCLLLEPNGRILAELKGEPANYQAGAEAAASAIKAILAEAIASSGVNRIDVLGIG
ncbi:MAG TPA: ATPase, partial [Firmicutes bacterium]|nr:ATPase [Bacillota bacterium]